MNNISLIQTVTLLALCSFAFYLGWICTRRRAAAILKDIESLMRGPGAPEDLNMTIDWEKKPLLLRLEPFVLITHRWFLSSRISCGCKLQVQYNASALSEPAVQFWIIERKCGKEEIPDIIETVGRLAKSSERLLSALEVPYECEALNIIEK